MEGHAVISHDVLASYAADAAREVPGVHELVDAARRHKGVRVVEGEGAITVEVHVALDWGAVGPDVAATVQHRVKEYLVRTARLEAVDVDVVVSAVAPAGD
jgi:uncharacterized alkaline shock family protein YloU